MFAPNPKAAVAAILTSSFDAKKLRDKVRKNIHSLRANLPEELKAAVAAFLISSSRTKKPRDKVRKNIHSLRAKLPAELNLGYSRRQPGTHVAPQG